MFLEIYSRMCMNLRLCSVGFKMTLLLVWACLVDHKSTWRVSRFGDASLFVPIRQSLRPQATSFYVFLKQTHLKDRPNTENIYKKNLNRSTFITSKVIQSFKSQSTGSTLHSHLKNHGFKLQK